MWCYVTFNFQFTKVHIIHLQEEKVTTEFTKKYSTRNTNKKTQKKHSNAFQSMSKIFE